MQNIQNMHSCFKNAALCSAQAVNEVTREAIFDAVETFLSVYRHSAGSAASPSCGSALTQCFCTTPQTRRARNSTRRRLCTRLAAPRD